MGLFSKELRELDRNTVQLMIDEMQEKLEQKREELEQKREELKHKSEELEHKKEELEQQKIRADKIEESERQKSKQLEAALRRIAELERQQS